MPNSPSLPPQLPAREWIAVVVLLLFMMGLVALVLFSQEDALPESLLPPHYCVSQELEVIIEGAVAHPGAYQMPKGSLLKDLFAKAEPIPEADLSRMKAERKLRQGQIIRVPHRAMITIHLEGAVKQSGPLRLPKGSRLCDLVDCVSFAEGADLKPLKKKRRLKEGEVIAVARN